MFLVLGPIFIEEKLSVGEFEALITRPEHIFTFAGINTITHERVEGSHFYHWRIFHPDINSTTGFGNSEGITELVTFFVIVHFQHNSF